MKYVSRVARYLIKPQGRQKRSLMATKLYVGNLPYTVNDQQLADYFSEAGEVVTANVVTDKFSGRSKGFGFVEFANDAEGDKAIADLNGQEMSGRKLVVNEARPKAPRA